MLIKLGCLLSMGASSNYTFLIPPPTRALILVCKFVIIQIMQINATILTCQSASSHHCLQDYRRGERGSETEATIIPGLWRKRRLKGDDLLSETLPPLKSDTLVLVKENYLNSKASWLWRFRWQIAKLCLDWEWNHLLAHLHNHLSPGRSSFLQRCLCDD